MDPLPSYVGAAPGGWIVVVLLWFVVCSNLLARMMLTTMHGSILAAFPMTEAQFGLLTAVFLWAYGLLSPFAGFMSDRFSRSRVIVASMCLWSALTFLTSYARSFEQLLVLRALMGVGEACYLPAALALISDYHRGSTRSLATGVHLSGFYIGMMLAGSGGWLAERYTWHFAFSLVGLIGLSYSLLLLVLLRDAPSVRPAAVAVSPVRFGNALRSLFGSRAYLAALLNWVLLGTTWAVFAWMPVFLQERFHLKQGGAGIIATSYSNTASLLGLLIGGFWADRWRRSNRRGRVLVSAIGLLVAAPSIFLTAGSSVLAAAIVGLIAYSLFLGFIGSNMMPILCEIVDERYRATAYGVLNMVGTIAGGLDIYAAGALRDRHYHLGLVFVGVAVVTLLCPLLLLQMAPRRLPKPALGGSAAAG